MGSGQERGRRAFYHARILRQGESPDERGNSYPPPSGRLPGMPARRG